MGEHAPEPFVIVYRSGRWERGTAPMEEAGMSDFDCWLEETFAVDGRRLVVGTNAHPTGLTRQQAVKLVAHLKELVEQIPTLNELFGIAGDDPEKAGGREG
jgi:hypothetical protein